MSYLSFPGEGASVSYPEGLFIGYRYYVSKEMEVLFPFGHGLSYTDFVYSDLCLDKKTLSEEEELTVSVKVTNTGKRAGKALVQLYVSPDKVEMIRPVRELKAFEKIMLVPGETRTVKMTLNRRAFAHWNPVLHDWACETGGYRIQICENAQKVLLEEKVQLEGKPIPPVGGYCVGTPMALLAKVPKMRKFLDENIIYLVKGMAAAGYIPKELLGFLDNLPGKPDLNTLNMIAKRAGERGGGAGGVQGLDALLGQPVSVLLSLLTEEKKQELVGLLDEENRRFSIDVNQKNYRI